MTEVVAKQFITKDMTIGEVVREYPSIVETLLSYGVHCVGCHVSYVETLEQGFKGHGMTDEEVEHVVKELNEAVVGNPVVAATEDAITITDFAVQKLKQILKEKNREDSALRIEVVTGGCNGMQYGFTFEDSPNTQQDRIFEFHGVKLVIDNESMSHVKGAKIDYSDALTNSGFKISNPNATSQCGCGQSFGA